jgi:hypothetical protein
MATVGIFQAEADIPLIDPGPALKHHGFHAHMLDPLNEFRLLDVDSEKLAQFVDHLQPQGQDISLRTANRYDIHRFMLHHGYPPPLILL